MQEDEVGFCGALTAGAVFGGQGVEYGGGEVGLVAYFAGGPFGDWCDGFFGSQSDNGAGEFDEKIDVAEELEGDGFWGVKGRVGVGCLGYIYDALDDEAG